MSTPEEREKVVDGLSEADRRFLAAIEDENGGFVGAGWRPWMGPRPEPTPEERAAVEAADAAAFQRFLAAAEGEGDGDIGAGWRPWMGPPRMPTAEEVAAFETNAAAVRARLRAEAIARVTVTDAQRWAVEDRPGEPVYLTDPATDRRFVLLPAEVYDRLVRAG